jgi:thiosulfate reductase / polysulfide reductase chain A
MTKLTRRDLLQLAGAVGGSYVAGCTEPRPISPATPASSANPATLSAVIDYGKAKAVPTICFGCTTHCGVIGWVQDGRVRKIEGNPLDPNSQGAACSKANGAIAYTYYPERILHPLQRVGPRGSGRWKRISWEQALDTIAAKLRPLRDEGRPEELVFHYGRDKTKGFTKRFTNAFGTPHRLNRRSICSSNRRAPLMSFYGRDFEWESQDFENTKYILNFGGNPMEAYQGGLFMIRRIMDAKVDRGAKMVTFEVRPSATASVSDEMFVVKPASDGLIALAMAHVIVKAGLENRAFWDRWANYPFDEMAKHLEQFTPARAERESGVPAADIERIAIEFAKAAPAATTMSNRGSAKHYNGMQNDRAIRMLDVLVGSVGRPGGFCLSTLRMWKNRYGQDGLPVIDQPKPSPAKLAPWKPGTREFSRLPKAVQTRVAAYPERWQNMYYGELATPSEYPLSWNWYPMRVGQLVYPYIRDGRQKVSAYISYCLGAAFGYPEANVARDVLKDESLIPFHVAIDISYGEQAALADIILPDATSLERWDAHSTNSYGLVPYTGIRQPLVEPLGEARPVQVILRDIARRVGGGMEKHFDFEDLEDYYRAWYKEVPGSWEDFKRRGIWYDQARAKDYELYERPLDPAVMKDAEVDAKTGLITSAKGKPIGVMQDGKPVAGFPTPSRMIQVYDEVFALAAKHAGVPLDDINAQPLVDWAPVPEHVGLGDDDYILTTFKWNVHTQGRSAYWKYNSEIVHTNQAFMSPKTGAKLGVKTGDEIRITVMRPKGHTYRANEKTPVGSFVNRARLLDGMHDTVVACSHHTGHWEHGPIAKAKQEAGAATDGYGPLTDPDMQRIWWSKAKGGPGGGVHMNDALPINPAPLIGGQNWFDNVCKITKI